jgi:hypothetical protein
MRFYVELALPSNFREDGALLREMEEKSIDWQIVSETGPIVCLSHERIYFLRDYVRITFFEGMVEAFHLVWKNVYSDEMPLERLKELRAGFLPWVLTMSGEYNAWDAFTCAGAQYLNSCGYPNAVFGSVAFSVNGISGPEYRLLAAGDNSIMSVPHTFEALAERLQSAKPF